MSEGPWGPRSRRLCRTPCGGSTQGHGGAAVAGARGSPWAAQDHPDRHRHTKSSFPTELSSWGTSQLISSSLTTLWPGSTSVLPHLSSLRSCLGPGPKWSSPPPPLWRCHFPKALSEQGGSGLSPGSLIVPPGCPPSLVPPWSWRSSPRSVRALPFPPSSQSSPIPPMAFRILTAPLFPPMALRAPQFFPHGLRAPHCTPISPDISGLPCWPQGMGGWPGHMGTRAWV